MARACYESSKDKLEIHIKYVKNKNHREIKFKGTGKWKNFKNEL